MRLEDHPTVRHVRALERAGAISARRPFGAEELKALALECGADDVGVIGIDRAELEPQRDEILRHYPWTRSLLSIVVRMAQAPVRGTPRSVANLEFHRAGHETNDICAGIVARLQDGGIRAVNPAMGFPMEMNQNPGNAIWIVAHKPVAVAAGMGRMGIHRNVIHPKFGNFVLLGTVLLDQEVDVSDEAIDYNPCLDCRLCVAACPVGAIKVDTPFDFQACFTHNYREFLGGFTDWVEQVADAKDALDYRRRVNEPETASMWQSLLDLGVPAGQIRTEAFGTDRRDPTRTAAGSDKVIGEVRFLNSGVTARAREGETLLDVAARSNVLTDSACRSGSCGTCMVRLRSGHVRMAAEDALTDDDREGGYVLACQAEPKGPIELEA